MDDKFYIPGDMVIKANDGSKSILVAGNLTIFNTKKFNWFQKKMWKIFFGFIIEDLEN